MGIDRVQGPTAVLSITRLALTMAALLAATTPALAHTLLIHCRVSDGRLRVEAYYEGTSHPPAANARIMVSKEGGEVVAEGRADDRGIWSCPAPADGKYVVTAETSGHRAEESLTVGAAAPPKSETEIPWARIGVGLGVIAALFAAVWLARRRSPPLS